MKSEPETFSIDDLKKVKIQFWDGVRNYQVRNMFRDKMNKGDLAFFYHSSTKLVGIAGEMKIAKTATVDESQFDPNSEYYDKGSKKDNPRWIGPTVKFVSKFKHLITLEQIRNNPRLQKLKILEKGNRLSVTEISEAEYTEIKKMFN